MDWTVSFLDKNSSLLMESLFPEDKDGERIASDVKECFQYVDDVIPAEFSMSALCGENR